MHDHSRMILCLFLLGIFIVNPFSSLLTPKFDYESGPGSVSSASGRSILSMETFSYSWKDLFQLSASTLLLSTIYVGLFVLGEKQIYFFQPLKWLV